MTDELVTVVLNYSVYCNFSELQCLCKRNHGHGPSTHEHSLYQYSHIIQRDVRLAHQILDVRWGPDTGQ